jgi:hypothetical protein
MVVWSGSAGSGRGGPDFEVGCWDTCLSCSTGGTTVRDWAQAEQGMGVVGGVADLGFVKWAFGKSCWSPVMSVLSFFPEKCADPVPE